MKMKDRMRSYLHDGQDDEINCDVVVVVDDDEDEVDATPNTVAYCRLWHTVWFIK